MGCPSLHDCLRRLIRLGGNSAAARTREATFCVRTKCGLVRLSSWRGARSYGATQEQARATRFGHARSDKADEHLAHCLAESDESGRSARLAIPRLASPRDYRASRIERERSDHFMSVAGHVSPKMLALYSHVRLQAKRKALDALATQPSTEVTSQATSQKSDPIPQVLENLVDVAGFEPATPCLQSRCSPS
jgi:hypothetical protein